MSGRRAAVDAAKDAYLSGRVLTKEQMLALLEIPLGSGDDQYLRNAAYEAAQFKRGGKGAVWCAIGMDFDRCRMNCRFCSFGEKWGIVEKRHLCSEEEVLTYAGKYVRGGAKYLVFRTTELYSIDELLKTVRNVRAKVPGNYHIVLNVGEFDAVTAEKMFEAGIYGVYHALRLREGTDTPFAPETRMATMRSVQQSPLALVSLVEPIGEEHTNGEIADRFLNTVRFGAAIGGAMARIPVKGTPLGGTKPLGESRLAQIIAVLRLSGGDVVKDICVHPASAEALRSGANIVVVESGAIPRDGSYSPGEWADLGMDKARRMLAEAGWEPDTAERDSFRGCSCAGKNLEKFIQPIIYSILENGPCNGYQIIKQMACYSTLRNSRVDPTGVYRYLKAMEGKRYIRSDEAGAYGITEEGRGCYARWKRTLRQYQASMNALLEELT